MTTPTTSRVSDAQRAAFERWISNPLEGGAFFVADDTDLRLDHEGEYEDSLIFGAWLAWQAALASLGDVVAVSEVQAVIDEMDKVDQMLDQGETYASNAVEDIVYHYQLKLSAILNRGGK